MKIYTKSGDKGTTSLLGKSNVQKDNIQVEAYGTIDELNSCIGVVISYGVDRKLQVMLESIQQDLFVIGGEVATHSSRQNIVSLESVAVTKLEYWIDELEPSLPKLKNFILPGGCTAAAMLHFTRCVCRRAERKCISLCRNEIISDNIIKYINRLSDLLFVLARHINFVNQHHEIKWMPNKTSQK